MSFVYISKIYRNDSQRNIEVLSNEYSEISKLLEILSSLCSETFINENAISGKSILIKPNWVTNDRKDDDYLCLRTNDIFLLAVIRLVLSFQPKIIIIGDAPIQGCIWDLVYNEKLKKEIVNLEQEFKIQILVKDFRRVTFDQRFNKLVENRKPLDEYVLVDLKDKSFLEPITTRKNRFRVTEYNPDRFVESHTIGKHRYCIAKDFFNVDTVISLPKVKTHQKSGITAALKNLVGINGDKDFLPHHRIGGTSRGGDCYPGGNYFRRIAEYALDNANRHKGGRGYPIWKIVSKLAWRLSFPGEVHHLAAGWYGNDTTWRMVLDLNLIANFVNKDGFIEDSPIRKVYSICDGIVGGQGDGPLNPSPLPLGIISFTDNSALNDICMAILMGFDYHNIPLLNFANSFINSDYRLMFDGKPIKLESLKKYSIITIPPPGWVDFFKMS